MWAIFNIWYYVSLIPAGVGLDTCKVKLGSLDGWQGGNRILGGVNGNGVLWWVGSFYLYTRGMGFMDHTRVTQNTPSTLKKHLSGPRAL
ncbi:hypothetical protein F5Y13DRAFT_11315 [Hypoxylon sp. FL1857]|nr:hypothetical protein F5Y13DRAFT_11315 [Hypoxylon sp. FL1857]